LKIKRRQKEGAEVSTESLNDIMFFLLLFFLIMSTLANPSVLKLNLPSSKTPAPKNSTPIIVSIDANHQYIINKTAIPFTDLESALKLEMERTQTTTILLALDRALSIQDLADVMQIGYGLGAKMVLQTTVATTK
jgi:biopolymer transport protein ExbD